MKNMVDTCPDGFKYKPKNKKETKIHPFYSTLTKNLSLIHILTAATASAATASNGRT